jgi:hypothetical protein
MSIFSQGRRLFRNMTTELQHYSKNDFSKYAGEWIALLDHELLAHGRILKEVYAEANAKAKGKTPFFLMVPKSADELIL